MTKKKNRYELKKRKKFGFYYFDNTFSTKMNLQSVLDRLNFYHTEQIKRSKIINELTTEINNLKEKNELKEKLHIFS